jgi:N-acetyltransferase B complex (NatB) non catalytic subunit
MSSSSSANSSSSRALNLIYSALDSHHYTRAIKLCLAYQQSSSAHHAAANYSVTVSTTNDALVMALLAHAYAKSGQRYKAMRTIHQLFGFDPTIFPELQLELLYASILQESLPAASSSNEGNSSSSTTASTTPGGSAKKGKKKSNDSTVNSLSTTPPSVTIPTSKDWDLIDQLDTPSTWPVDWETRIPPPNAPLAKIVTGTLLGTLSMTLTAVLRLPLTAYQLYCWALTTLPNASTHTTAASLEDRILYTHQAYLNGLVLLLVTPSSSSSTHATILTQLQGLALQVARATRGTTSAVSLWAAQTALWQVVRIQSTTSEPEEPRHALLPRLAESLALKCVEEHCRRSDHAGIDPIASDNPSAASELTTTNNTSYYVDTATNSETVASHSLLATESLLLYLQTLAVQGKWLEQVQILDQYQKVLPQPTWAELRLTAFQHLEGQAPERLALLEHLIQLYPDDWQYWMQYLDAALAEYNGELEPALSQTEALVTTVVGSSNASSEYPLRGPRLMQIECALRRVRLEQQHKQREEPEENALEPTRTAARSALLECIMSYANDFGSRASCIFSDLRPYLQECLQTGTDRDATVLLDWSQNLRGVVPASTEARVRQGQLRMYILAVQVNFLVLSLRLELSEGALPPWEELVNVWKAFQSFEHSENVDQVCQIPYTMIVLGYPEC